MEYIAEEPERPRLLGEIADRFRLNHATCANILKTLVKRNYIDQKAPRKGYTLGPMAYFLARKGPYRRDIVEQAEGPVEKLASQIQETVIVATLKEGRRFILVQVEEDRTFRIRPELFYLENVYSTATGRLLLAYESGEALNRFVSIQGLPAGEWPEAGGKKKLEEECARIRGEGKVDIKAGSELRALALPIRENDAVLAALGVYLPEYRFSGRHKQRVLKGMKQTAEEISRKLSELKCRARKRK